MVVPLVFILPGYFRIFSFCCSFWLEKNCLTEVFYLSATLLKIRLDIQATDHVEIRPEYCMH